VTASTPIRQQQVDPFERHYTPKELAELWRLDESTVRRMFQDETGVLKIGSAGRRDKRDYVTLRIPASTAARFYRERMG
jgi:AraC-like DNA-binding protein